MNKIFQILIFFLIAHCGFQPIYSSKNFVENIKVKTVIYKGDKSFNNKLENKFLAFFINNENAKLEINIESIVNKIISSKDSKGNPSTYELKVQTLLLIYEDGGLKNKINFEEISRYDNKDNKFELKLYEKTIIESLSLKISNQIKRHISTLPL